MKIDKLICLDFNGNELDSQEWDQIDTIVGSRVLEKKELLNNLDCEVLFVKLGAKVDKDLMDKLPNLKYIGMLGTGYGGIDVKYATSRGITVTNIADYATEGVAEFTFAILLEYLRDISKAKAQAKNGNYSDDFSGSEIKGKKFGVIGLGNIGQRTAELAQAFGTDVSYWSKNRKPESENKGMKYAEIDEILANSDIITLNLEYNPKTERIISSHRIKLIKKGAVFINPSPMELIDFDPLVERLKHEDITFLLDHSDEMTGDQLEILRPIDNAIIYPPIAYLTKEATQLKKRIFVDNLKNFLASSPTNKVN